MLYVLNDIACVAQRMTNRTAITIPKKQHDAYELSRKILLAVRRKGNFSAAEFALLNGKVRKRITGRERNSTKRRIMYPRMTATPRNQK